MLFPPPTETWLQRVSSDPEAQGWGVWSWTEKTPLKPEGGKVEDDEEDTGFPPFLLDREDLSEDLAEYSVPDQELEAIKLKLWAMEQAQGPELPRAQGQVDCGVIAGELEAYFNICGEVQQVTILCNKFSGHPKGYAYIEFATESSAQAAVGLDKSIFQGRVIKVLLTVFYPKQFLFRCIFLILCVRPLRGQSEPRSPSFPVDCRPEQAKVEEGWKALLDVAAMGSEQ